MNFYQTTNVYRREPDVLGALEYVSIKTRTDGAEAIVMSPDTVDAPGLRRISQENAQAILDDWIEAERTAAEFAAANPDPNDRWAITNPGVHNRIDLDAYSSPVLWEQAKLNRIARGVFTSDEAADFVDVQTMRDAYPLVTQGFTQADADMLLEKMTRAIGG